MLLEMDQGQYIHETVPLKREDKSASICVFQKLLRQPSRYCFFFQSFA